MSNRISDAVIGSAGQLSVQFNASEKQLAKTRRHRRAVTDVAMKLLAQPVPDGGEA